MKAAMAIINWDAETIPIVDFFSGKKADIEARECWEQIKHDWPGCTARIELDEELKTVRVHKNPSSIRITDDVITMIFHLPNTKETRAAIVADDRAQIFAHVNASAPMEGSFFSLHYALKATPKALEAFDNDDWSWLIEQSRQITGDT